MVSGPGGVGKGTTVAHLARRRPDVVVSVSATTREPRPGEVDGQHYHFLSEAAFDALIAADGLLEWAEFNGHRYGTGWQSVAEALETRRPVVLEIDVQGARQVRANYPEAVLVFLTAPSESELRNRFAERGSEDDQQIAARLRIAEWELAQADEFDHRIVNEDLDRTVAQLSRIIDQMPVRSSSVGSETHRHHR